MKKRSSSAALNGTLAFLLSCAATLASYRVFSVRATIPGEPVVRVSPTERILGRLVVGVSEPPAADFQIENVGNAPLLITDVKASCGCARLELDTTEVPPGGSALLKVLIRELTRTSPLTAAVAIYSNDRVNRVVNVRLAWELVPAVEFQPSHLSLDLGRDGTTAVGRAVLLSNVGSALSAGSVRTLVCWPDSLTARIEQGSAQSQPTTDVDPKWAIGELRVEAPLHALGPRREGFVRLELPAPYGTAELPVSWEPTTGLEVSPEFLSLEVARPGGVQTRRLILRSREGQRFSVKEVSCPSASLAVSAALPTRPASAHLLALDITTPPRPGPFETTLRIRTDRSDQPEIRLRVTGLVAKPEKEPVP